MAIMVVPPGYNIPNDFSQITQQKIAVPQDHLSVLQDFKAWTTLVYMEVVLLCKCVNPLMLKSTIVVWFYDTFNC